MARIRLEGHFDIEPRRLFIKVMGGSIYNPGGGVKNVIVCISVVSSHLGSEVSALFVKYSLRNISH